MFVTTPELKEDPRVTRTRQLLHNALLELLSEKNFQAITIQDIAERATVNRVTFYAHFQDKFALLEYSIRENFKLRLRTHLPETTTFTPENLASLIRAVCEFLGEMNRVCPPPHGQMEPLMEKQIKGVVYEVLFSWLKDFPSPNLLEQKAMITAWAIYGAANQWSQKSKPEPINAFVEQVLPIIEASLNVQLA
ncbi:MAG: TetR/AcrR family transcriptional regulator [Anaerolineales bacterium]